MDFVLSSNSSPSIDFALKDLKKKFKSSPLERQQWVLIHFYKELLLDEKNGRISKIYEEVQACERRTQYAAERSSDYRKLAYSFVILAGSLLITGGTGYLYHKGTDAFGTLAAIFGLIAFVSALSCTGLFIKRCLDKEPAYDFSKPQTDLLNAIINIPEFIEENSKSQLVNMRYSSDINTLRMKLGKHVAKLDKSNSVDEKKEEAFVKLSFPQENIPLLPVASVEIDKEQREQIAKQIDKEGNYLFDVIIPKMGVHTQHQYKPHAIFYHAFEIPNGQLVFNWLYNKVTNAEENQTNEDYGTMQPVSFQAP